jgi:hypothetical protein
MQEVCFRRNFHNLKFQAKNELFKIKSEQSSWDNLCWSCLDKFVPDTNENWKESLTSELDMHWAVSLYLNSEM